MFFNKKKKTKVDAKVRFQNRGFTQKLDRARSFKRQPRSLPTNAVDQFLYRVGLESRFAQIGLAALVLAAVYIVYIPNFLTVSTITVSGLGNSDRIIAEGAAKEAISSASFYNPQHNLLFMNTDRIAAEIQSVPSVHEIVNVKKDYKNKTVHVEVIAKYERFLVATPDRVFDVYNDGILKGVAGIDVPSWPTTFNSQMVKVKLYHHIAGSNTQFFNEDTVRKLNELADALQTIPSAPLAYIAFDKEPRAAEGEVAEVETKELPVSGGEWHVHLQKGNNPSQTFMVMLDSQVSIADTVQRLQLLLEQTNPDRFSKLYYIDMRLENRGYLCLVNTPCAQ